MPSQIMTELSCLNKIKRIIELEPFYQLQLLSIEPVNTILELFRLANIQFDHYYISLKEKIPNDDIDEMSSSSERNQNRENRVIILVNDCSNKCYTLLKSRYDKISYILISKEIVPLHLYVPLEINEDDTFLYLKSVINQESLYIKENQQENIFNTWEYTKLSKEKDGKGCALDSFINLHIKKYYKNYPLYLLRMLLFKKIEKIVNLSTLECYLIMSLIENKKFHDIFRALDRSYCQEEGPENKRSSKELSKNKLNEFEVLMTLNNLIRYKFVRKRGNSYHLNISKEYATEICKKIGFDIEKKKSFDNEQ